MPIQDERTKETRSSASADELHNPAQTKVESDNILLGYGKWTQYSLFECFLTRKQLVLLGSKLEKYLVARQDSVRFYPLCANCVSRVETVGGPLPSDDTLFVV
jgi:CRISPR-associated protein Cas2